MKPFKLFYILFLLTIKIYAQQPTPLTTLELPIASAPSPQAYELTKYANIQVDESSGKINSTIPIGNFRIGNLEVPITLNYNGNGVKVEQKPTWTGINWVLNAGGVITRSIKDLPDETDQQRRIFTESEIISFYTVGFESSFGFTYGMTNEAASFFQNHNLVDTEADIFNFSFPGGSGSFYLKEESDQFIPVMIKCSQEFKIKLYGSFSAPFGFNDYGQENSQNPNYYFSITTTDGTEYFFGGLVYGNSVDENKYAFEETQLIDRSTNVLKKSLRVKTAFYLNKIVSYNGDTAYFVYHTQLKHEVFHTSDQKIKRTIARDNLNDANVPEFSDFENRLIKNTIYNAKFLKRIWSNQNNNYVEFESEPVYEQLNSNLTNITNLKYRVLNKIVFNDSQVDLTYYPSINYQSLTNKDKFFLTNVIFKDQQGQQIKNNVSMEYNDLDNVPPLRYFGQDYLGFNNGVNNNLTLLPKKSSLLLVENFKKYIPFYNPDLSIFRSILGRSNFTIFNNILADREPNFHYAKKGSLEKIKYATGGFTRFEYEPDEKKKIFQTETLTISHNVATPQNSILNDQFIIGSNTLSSLGTYIPSSIPSQLINVKLNIGTIIPVTPLSIRDFVSLRVLDITNGLPGVEVLEERIHIPHEYVNSSNTESNGAEADISFDYYKGKIYKLELGFGYNYFPPSNPYFTSVNNQDIQYLDNLVGTALITYQSGVDPDDGLGIRVRRVKDYKDEISQPEIKRYYYGTIQDLDNSLKTGANRTYLPTFHKFGFNIVSFIEDNGTTQGAIIYDLELNSNSFAQNLYAGDTQSVYKNVTISYGGDDFEIGGIEKSFFLREDYYQIGDTPNSNEGVNIFQMLAHIFSRFDESRKSNIGNFNGTLTKESTWKRNESDVLLKTNEKIYKYDTIIGESLLNLNLITLSQCSHCFSGVVFNLFFGKYYYQNIKLLLKEIIEKEYAEPIPFNSLYYQNYLFNWDIFDDDNNGVNNFYDDDYYLIHSNDFESNYKKIVKSITLNYGGENLASMPFESITNSSIDGINKKVKYFYPIPSQINLVANSSAQDLSAFNELFNKNRISEPIQIESYENDELLSRQKKTYFQFSNNPIKVYPNKVFSSKGAGQLELQSEIISYDENGNPRELWQNNGTNVVYIWNANRQPIFKIVNATYQEWLDATASTPGTGLEEPELPNTSTNWNPYSAMLPKAQITFYGYNPINKQLSFVVDPKGDKITYHYDIFNRLEFIKDRNGNIISENKYNYRPQN